MLCGIKYAQHECPQYPYKTRVISDDITVINMSHFIIQCNSYPESLWLLSLIALIWIRHKIVKQPNIILRAYPIRAISLAILDLGSVRNPHVLRVRSGFTALSVSKLAAPITPNGIGSKYQCFFIRKNSRRNVKWALYIHSKKDCFIQQKFESTFYVVYNVFCND